MIDKLQDIISRYNELTNLMNQPDAINNHKIFAEMAKEHSGLTEIVEKSQIYIKKYIRCSQISRFSSCIFIIYF